ncbi:hypothetical protein F4820DRAFT_441441 [Hypoxylon rubiginosum]|uniref:Uncharacterized protein n=1 Tax=Hypoxylon rubiginosum TaxID=110542 RepID=A0ACB9YIU7_9PEZI|nr:hypothetical protein F4820DRAFT_441441 [Hypoxylon rubiginosum]
MLNDNDRSTIAVGHCTPAAVATVTATATTTATVTVTSTIIPIVNVSVVPSPASLPPPLSITFEQRALVEILLIALTTVVVCNVIGSAKILWGWRGDLHRWFRGSGRRAVEEVEGAKQEGEESA